MTKNLGVAILFFLLAFLFLWGGPFIAHLLGRDILGKGEWWGFPLWATWLGSMVASIITGAYFVSRGDYVANQT